jgi:hypothetical protein
MTRPGRRVGLSQTGGQRRVGRLRQHVHEDLLVGPRGCYELTRFAQAAGSGGGGEQLGDGDGRAAFTRGCSWRVGPEDRRDSALKAR